MSGLIRRRRHVEDLRVPFAPIPVRWIDTQPVKITDKPCTISSLDVKVRVCGLYADVTQTMVIANPNKRDLSVSIAIPMPDRAVVCGYALDIDGTMVDGVVVPQEKARVAFETEQRRGADPGLVEAVKGNVYRTRVYPVPAHKTRTVQLRYTAPLLVVDGQSAFLDAPMPAERLGNRTVRVDVELLDCPAPELSGVNDAQFKELGTYWVVESRECDVAPASGIRVALPKLPSSFAVLERDDAGEVWFAASASVAGAVQGDVPQVTSLTVLWDESGSRTGVDHGAELELLRGYCASEAIDSYRLITFSDHAEGALTFENAHDLLDYIGSIRYDGGSNFQALSQAIAELPDAGEGEACVLFTDGMDTLSGEPFAFPEGRKVLAVVSGVERDMEALRQACGGLVFDQAIAPKGPEALAQALFCPRFLSGVKGEGAQEVVGIGSGGDGRYAVIGKLVAPSADLAFDNAEEHFALDAACAREGNTLSHAWAATRVAQLSPRSSDNADELLSLGRRFGVVSPATSLIVLETIDQWLRYDIEPPSTWESMHREWERYRQGMMKVSSEQGLKDDHLMSLRRSWADLRAWWSRDYTEPEFPPAVGFCPSCGASVEPDSRFCRRCGAPVAPPQIVDGAGGGFRGQPLPRSASRMASGTGADFGVAYSRSMSDVVFEDGDFAMSSLAMPESVEASPSVGAEPSNAEASPTAASVKVQAWMPDAAYLSVLGEARGNGLEAARDAYFQQRLQHSASPSFFIDCAGWFLAHDDRAFGLRVLTNLAELRIEDAALLRVMAWRLREAGERRRALVILRRVLKLRPEDSQSYRDLALVLDELAREAFGDGDEPAAKDFAEEAGAFYREIARTPWQRRAIAIGLFAVEEYNVLRAWADAQSWKSAPRLESLGDGFEGVLDCDLRITLAWDADETDVDLHVTEPSGEEAYYGNRLTHAGGRVSEDITDGYGPELYEIRHAKDGAYAIRAHYFASHQQTVFGPASCTLTVYTDWGRPTQRRQITSTRLESEKEMVPVGVVTYGSIAEDGRPSTGS